MKAHKLGPKWEEKAKRDFERWWTKYQGTAMQHSKYLARKAFIAARQPEVE